MGYQEDRTANPAQHFLKPLFGPSSYTWDRNVWGDRPFYLVKQPQEKWACDFHDDAPPLSFQLQVAEVIF